jgi:hypothetical protein
VVLYGVGLIAVARTGGLRWLLAAHAIMAVCLVDEMVTGILRRLWTWIFPWSTADRLLSIQYWVLPLLMAAGLIWIGGAVGVALARRPDARRAASRVIAAGAVVATVTGSVFVARQYHDEVASRTVVDGVDMNVMARMSAALPAGAPVAADGADAGEWIEALTPDRLYFSKLYIQSHQADVRLTLFDQACEHPVQAADASLFSGVVAVFVGAHQASGAPHRAAWPRCPGCAPWPAAAAATTRPPPSRWCADSAG